MIGSNLSVAAGDAVIEVAVVVNGQVRNAQVEARRLLSDFLRHDVGLTGTHVGCEGGACGACTVLIDGQPARSCLAFAVQVSGSEVETVESLGSVDDLHPVQVAFKNEHGLQCGFCTPGILMAVVAAKREGLGVEEAVSDVLGGHMCSCTGFAGIRAAIRSYWESDASNV